LSELAVVLAKEREGAPQGESLESEYDLGAALACDATYEREVAAQQTLFDYVARRRKAAVIFGADVGIDHGIRNLCAKIAKKRANTACGVRIALKIVVGD